MRQNNNFSVIPFYKTIGEQNHLKNYAYGNIFTLSVPKNTLIPFQIIREHSDDDEVLPTIFHMLSGGTISYELQYTIKHYEDLGIDVIVYEATEDLSFLPLSLGRQYMEVRIGGETWYSDIITLTEDESGKICVEWWDDDDIVMDAGIIAYSDTTFKNKLYLCSEIGKPEYPFSEEGENRDGYFFAEKQISEKRYKFNITAPEYLCDVMRFIRMADHIKVTDTYEREYNCDSFLITPNWLEQGDLANVECEFSTDTIVKKIGKGYARNI